MLIVERRVGEEIDVTLEDGRRIRVCLVAIDWARARIGIDAPKTITVDRREITRRKLRLAGVINGNVEPIGEEL